MMMFCVGALFWGIESFAKAANDGDIYIHGEYEYRYNYSYWAPTSSWAPSGLDGWEVRVLDTTKSEYGEILSEIDGAEVVTLRYTFQHCKNLEILATK